MNDLISRQEAIKAILGEPPEVNYPIYYAEKIRELPSVQPETNCSEIPNNSDLISRQAAIRIAEQGQVQGYEWQFKKLCELPSVQPKERCIANITLNEEDLEKIVKEQVEEIKELLPQKGEWIWDGDIFDLEKEYICRKCRCYALEKDGNQIRSNFCPNCGADMREGDAE